MGRTLSLAPVILLAGIVILGCAGPATPSPPSVVVTPVAPGISKAEWERKWDRVLEDAKKEGSVSLYSIWSPDARAVLVKRFKEEFGLDLEVSPFARSSEVYPKVQAEKRAGLNVADVFGTGGAGLTYSAKPAGLLGPIEPLLILPEVLEPKAWVGGKIPFYDKDKKIIGMISNLNRLVYINRNLIKEGEITSLKDLLKPQYKGKIVMDHPNTGGGIFVFTHLAHNVWDLKETSEFYRFIIKDLDAVISRDPRQQADWVATGKYPLGFALSYSAVGGHITAGAPISMPVIREPIISSPGNGALAVLPDPPHPNAATVFVNWLLTKEGQTLFSRGTASPSLRVDVPVEGLHPDLFPRPGEKVYLASEEFALLQGELVKVADRIVEEAQK